MEGMVEDLRSVAEEKSVMEGEESRSGANFKA